MSNIIPSDTKFITAVIHWLSLFPNSPILFDDVYERLYEPIQIIKILNLIMDDSFHLDNSEDEEESFSNKLNDIRCYKAIFQKVLVYYKNNLKSRKKIFKFLELIRFEDFIPTRAPVSKDLRALKVVLSPKTDHGLTSSSAADIDKLSTGVHTFHLDQTQHINYNLNLLCFIFFEIGLHSYKSSICISLISLLSEEDQYELKSFMHDEQDLKSKSLIMEERLKLLELENASVKRSFVEMENELKRTRKKLKHLENECEKEILGFNKTLQKKDEEIQLLKSDINRRRKENKSQELEIRQLNDDLKTLNLSLNPSASSSLSSSSKKKLKRIALDAAANAPITKSEYPYEMLLFDHKMISKVLRDYVLEKFSNQKDQQFR